MSTALPLSQSFCQHLPERVAKVEPDAALEGALLALCQQGQQAWPGIDLPALDFVRHLSRHLPPEQAPLAFLAAVAASDLYLACACVEQLPAAVAQFLSTFGARIPNYLGRLGRNPEVVNEVRQIIATRCIVGDEAHPPALTTYSATGSLEGWLDPLRR